MEIVLLLFYLNNIECGRTSLKNTKIVKVNAFRFSEAEKKEVTHKIST